MNGKNLSFIDSWTDDGIFFYTARNDKEKVTRRDHFKNGKEVYLFSYGQRRGWVRFVGHMVCTGFHFNHDSSKSRTPSLKRELSSSKEDPGGQELGEKGLPEKSVRPGSASIPMDENCHP